MASTSTGSKGANLIENFCAVTGADEDVAKRMLEACSGNLEMAINMHVDSEWTAASNSSDDSATQARRRETHSPASFNTDDVRPPIPPVREVLVESSYSYGFHGPRRASNSVFDGFRDFQAEMRIQEENLRHSDDLLYKKRKTLEDLFRPPLDLIHRGSFQSAREVGKASNKWLMVNIQNGQEFACQVLNRDVWSNQTIKAIISEHFVFWQVYHDSEEGQRYILFYKVVEYPYIAILDPRTGEKILSWSQVDAVRFCDAVTEFLASHPTPDGTALSPPKKRIKSTADSDGIFEESEESQIKAAIEASLKEAAGKLEAASDEDHSDLETFDSDTEYNNTRHASSVLEGSPMCTTSKSSSNPSPPQPTRSEDFTRPGAEGWEAFLGGNDDPKSELMIRFPDGSRRMMAFPCTSQLRALITFAACNGFLQETHELVTNFPRRNLSEVDPTMTLKDAGLFPKETVFVQQRST